MLPSSLMISHMTPIGRQPASLARSTAASVWPARAEATVFSVAHGDEVFLGVTPEQLVRVESSTLVTHALAGTVSEATLSGALDDEKLKREHGCVVANITADLAPLTESVEVESSPRLRRAGALHHLESRITGALRPGVSLFSIMAALHPTAALGGAPRDAARAWLSERETLDRGYYGAPIGWMTAGGDGVCAVAIRSALLAGSTAWAFAGAGIVAGSSPVAEWDETTSKLSTITEHLATGTDEVDP